MNIPLSVIPQKNNQLGIKPSNKFWHF